MVDRDREPSASGAHEGIAHETLYPPDETFHFSFVLLQEVEKRLSPFARIVSHHSMHDTPPTADVLHCERRKYANDSRTLRAPHSPTFRSRSKDNRAIASSHGHMLRHQP